jgi:type IV secretory pathway component VirB8
MVIGLIILGFILLTIGFITPISTVVALLAAVIVFVIAMVLSLKKKDNN